MMKGVDKDDVSSWVCRNYKTTSSVVTGDAKRNDETVNRRMKVTKATYNSYNSRQIDVPQNHGGRFSL